MSTTTERSAPATECRERAWQTHLDRNSRYLRPLADKGALELQDVRLAFEAGWQAAHDTEEDAS